MSLTDIQALDGPEALPASPMTLEHHHALVTKLDVMSLLMRGTSMTNAQKELYVRVLLASEDAPTVAQLLRTLDHLITWWEGPRVPLPGHILRTRRQLLEEGSLSGTPP